MSLYSLSNISRTYNGRPALLVESLAIEAGTITGVVGPNGGGKSTLMRMLAFLEAPDKGTLLFDGQPAGPDAPAVRQHVTLLTQEPYLLRRTVAENVSYGLAVRGEKNTGLKVAEALDCVGLDSDQFMRRHWFELSGGEAQRVALAARLVLTPRVLLMDEPTASVDEESAQLIRNAALDMRKTHGTTLVIVSHDKEWLSSVADRMLVVRGGVLEEQL